VLRTHFTTEHTEGTEEGKAERIGLKKKKKKEHPAEF